MDDYIDQFARGWTAANPESVEALRRSGTSGHLDEVLVIGRVMRLHRFLDDALVAALRGHRLSRAEFDILSVLAVEGSGGSMRPGVIATRTLATSGGTSTTLRRLESRGFVDREPAGDDGRSWWVRITAAGSAAIRAASLDAVTAQAAVLRGVPLGAVNDALRSVLREIGDLPVRDARES